MFFLLKHMLLNTLTRIYGKVWFKINGWEVQFNLSNNLDKDFYLNGNVKLCDYYNYGYTNEGTLFCGLWWWIFWFVVFIFDRDSFDNVYQALLDGNVDMKIAASIPI